MFVDKIKKEYGNDINIKVIRGQNGYGYLIEITQGSYNRFMEIIGPCPSELIPVLGYKWK